MNTLLSGAARRNRACWLLGRGFAAIFSKILLGVTVILISGCATFALGPPSDEEAKEIEAGDQVVVIARVQGTSNGAPYSLYEAGGNPPTLQFKRIALGIDHWGHGDAYGNPRFLDVKTLSEGWIYFLVKPGDHDFWFMSISGMTNLQASLAMRHAPRYQFNVPEGVEVLYIGSIVIPVVERGRYDKWAQVGFNPHDAELVDETSLANDLARTSMPKLEKFSAVLMEPKEEEDMILQKPGN